MAGYINHLGIGPALADGPPPSQFHRACRTAVSRDGRRIDAPPVNYPAKSHESGGGQHMAAVPALCFETTDRPSTLRATVV